MEKIYSFATTGSRPIESILESALSIDYRKSFDGLKKTTSDQFESGNYEVELFRPKRTEKDALSNAALDRKSLLKRFPSDDGWMFATLEHLVALMNKDRSSLIIKAAGIPVVAIGSCDESLNCPVLHTYAISAEGFLIDLEESWFFEEMPYFLRLRRAYN